MNAAPPLLSIEDLVIEERTRAGAVPIVDGVSLAVGRGETVCLVGESGCGKSLTALSVLRLLDPPLFAGGGRILFGGKDLLRLPEPELRKVRGKRIAMIFQEPMTALNPVLTVGEQIVEVLTLHEGLSRKAARARTIELLGEVRLPAPARQVDAYPHVLSGGMRQRVLIAMALACGPELLIADEPTTALDVTVQAQILALLDELQQRRGMSLLLITHDLGVVAEMARRVAVMYAGRIVEEAPVRALFHAPQHPYTRALLRSLPAAAPAASAARTLASIPGQVPAPAAYPPGCRFHPRCEERLERCAAAAPRWTAVGDTRVACFAREAQA